MRDTATYYEPLFERDMCLEGSHDFEDDIDFSLFPDLLRMVEQVEKQILPYKELLGYMTSPYVEHEGHLVDLAKRV